MSEVWQVPTRCLQLGCPKDTRFSSPELGEHGDVLRFLVPLPGTGQDWSGWGLVQVCSGSPTPGQLQLVRSLTLLMSCPELWQSLALSFKY